MRVVGRGLFVLGMLFLTSCEKATDYPPGVLAPKTPIQERVSSAPIFRSGDYVMRPLARFEIEARVLSTERYLFDRGAAISPVDFALGWGPMSDQSVLDKVSISQGGRFYRWRVKEFPIPRNAIIQHSANMHMIPSTPEVKEDLLKVRMGEIVQLEGYLVNVSSDNGMIWKTSLSRKDSGDGACELVWVERVLSYPADLPYASLQ